MDIHSIESLDALRSTLELMASSLFSNDPGLQQIIVPAQVTEEARSRVAAHAAGLVILDEEGMVISVNDEAERIFAVPRRDVVGNGATMLFCTSGGGAPPLTLRTSLDRGKKILEISPGVLGRRPNGATFPLDLRTFEVTLLGRQIFLLEAQNLLEKRRLEEPMRRAEARYRALVEQIPAVTFMAALDDEGKNEMYVSPQIESLLGFSQREWLDDPVLWFKRLHPDDQDLWNREFARGVASGGPFRAECRVIARDGSVVWIHGEARLVKDESGRPLMLQGIAFDITESKRAAQEIREAQEAKLRNERLAAIGRLAAGIGHDIRNPLAAIRNAFHYVKRRLTGTTLEGDARLLQILSIIDQEVLTCTRIVGDLLDYARERQPFWEMCVLAPLVTDAIRGVQAPPHVVISNDVPDTLPVCDLDKGQFRQVLVNLIQNAAEAIPPERAGRVRVTASTMAEQMELAVSDNGNGISEENREKIFEPLFTTKAQGTGLGLAIVSNIVARHGGTFDVKSRDKVGTTFTIRLPIRSPPAAARTGR